MLTSRIGTVLTWLSAWLGFAALAGHSGDFGHDAAVAQRLILVERQANVVIGRLIETGAEQHTVRVPSVLVVRAEREEYRLRRKCRHLPTDAPAP